MRRRTHGFVLLFLVLTAAACGERVQDEPVADVSQIVDADSPPALAQAVGDLMPRLERLSGLDRIETLRVRMQDRDAARRYVMERLDTEMPPAEREGVRRVYVALGLLPDTLDLDALLVDLYTEQVLGYYDPSTKTMWVIDGADPDALHSALAHELVHALQDQHTDLDSLVARGVGNDRQTAAHAAMEGHAMLVMFAVLAEESTGRRIDPAQLPDPSEGLESAIAAQNEQFPVFRNAPRVIRETLLFPYLGGAGFVHALWSARAPLDRYPAPLDSLLPRSTEQVMRPRDRFIETRDAPSALAWPEPPAGWTVVREDDLGQLETAILLEQHLGASARRNADGWDGDRYLLLQDAGGGEALLWDSVWDSERQADAFARALTRALPAATVSRAGIDGVPAVRLRMTTRGTAAPPSLDAVLR